MGKNGLGIGKSVPGCQTNASKSQQVSEEMELPVGYSRYVLPSCLPLILTHVEELQKTGQKSHIRDPKYTLPMCTAIQIALVDLLETWNITPAFVVGHGSGEIAAAYVFSYMARRITDM